MKKRIIDLRDERPLLDIVSYGRAGRMPTPTQRLHIALTVHRAPEVMVKVSGGARTLSGVERHMAYIGREGNLGLETDTGDHIEGKGFQRSLVDDWNLDVDSLQNHMGNSALGRKPPKLVHNIIFSMPSGTSPKAVLRAVEKLAVNEWALQHRYAMALHTDNNHPHVHVVLKAVSEDGVRLNIKKETLRAWRAQFAENLQELGVAANATERAVRGQPHTHKRTAIYRAEQRNESSHMRKRRAEALRETAVRTESTDPGHVVLSRTRQFVIAGWHAVAAQLSAGGEAELAEDVRRFVGRMPAVRTENAMRAVHLTSLKGRGMTTEGGRLP